METKSYYIYNEKQIPSVQSFSIEELRNKGIKPETILCERKERVLLPAKEFPELESIIDWTPPVVAGPNGAFKLPFRGKQLVYAAAVVASIGGGTIALNKVRDTKTESEKVENTRLLGEDVDKLKSHKTDVDFEVQGLEAEVKKQLTKKEDLVKKKIRQQGELDLTTQKVTSLNEEIKKIELSTNYNPVTYTQWKADKEATLKSKTEDLNRYNRTITEYQISNKLIEETDLPKIESDIQTLENKIKEKKKELENSDSNLKSKQSEILKLNEPAKSEPK